MKIYEQYGRPYLYDHTSHATYDEVTREIADTGTVYSLTKVFVPPTEFAHEAPYCIGIIQLDEANLKITARIKDGTEIGSRVKLDAVENGVYYFSELV